jgi:hypothetical protein
LPDTADDDSGPLTYDDDFLMSDEPEDVLSVNPEATLDEQGPAESVAEKLRRIRAVVSRNMEIDHTAARSEQTPNAGRSDLRSRAMSETIRQIQDDLSDDEDGSTTAPDDDDEDDAAQLDAGHSANAASAAGDAFNAATEVEDNDEDEDTEGGRSYTEMLGHVTDRLAQGEDDDNAPVEEAPAPRRPTRVLSPGPEVDMGRLMDETDSKLNEDETVRRRRVISQMRAAVAATKADRMVSNQPFSREAEEEAEKSRYREDLSEAVSDAPSAETARRASAPPLVLVSSQRIDPQLRASLAGAAEFAASFGARELPELMEAAAAYAIFSEGQSSFTRPEIMELVTRMDPALQMSREESLRSFGQLLREGTFKKLERGQFTIDQETRYNPSNSAADG